MSYRARIIASALGLALILLIGWSIYATGLKLGETKAENTYHTSRYSAHAANQIQQSCLSGDEVNLSECVAEVIRSTNEDQRAQDDLEAQTKMALWAFWMLVATVVMAIITGFGVVFVWQTLKATREMARDTSRIGEAQVRAYLSVLDAKIKGIGPGMLWEVTFGIQNTGQSPARIIRYATSTRSGTTPEAARFVNLTARTSGDISSGNLLPEKVKANTRLSQDSWDAILVRSRYFVIGGYVVYLDVFGRTRRLVFRYAIDAATIDGNACRLLVAKKNNKSS